MTIDINQFWTLLSESDLVAGAKTQALFTSFSTDQSVDKEPQSLAKWLVAQKAISSYQAKILTAGHSGPFRYGSYVVVERIESGFMQGQFKARHVKTGFPVLLHFFAGNQPEDLKTWQTIESVVDELVPIEHPNLAETFETVVLSNRRFIVAQLPSGDTLDDKLPRKSRLPWKQACLLMAQAANGLVALHKQNVAHGAVSPRTIWLEKSGLVQLRMNAIPDCPFEKQNDEKGECKLDYLAPESVTDETTQDELFSRDLYALGCTLYRIIAGRPPFPEPDPAQKKQQQLTTRAADLAKYELPTELDQLIKRLLNKRLSERPKSATEVVTLLGLLSGKANEINALAIPKSKPRDAYRRSLSEFFPEAEKASVAAAPEIETVEAPDPEAAQELAESRQAKIQTAAESASKRKRGKWKIPAAIAGTLLAISGLIGWLAMTADRIVVVKPLVNKTENVSAVEQPAIGNANVDLANLPLNKRPTLLQELIDDDDQSLWESPTSGPPIQFSFLPSATKMLFVFRPSEFVSMDEGLRVTQSMGPGFEARIDQLENQLGVDLENISELTVSLHTTEDFEYESFFIVRTNQPIEFSQLMQNWNRPSIRTLKNQQTVYDSSDEKSAYYVIYDANSPADEETDSEEVQSPVDQPINRFAFGSKKLIDEVAGSLGVSVLPATFTDLAESTDQDRHVNILFLRNSLFNEEGQKLMGLENISFNRELGVMVPDDVRGGSLSLHLDSGSYFELILDKNVDLKSNALKTIMIDAFRSRRDMLMGHVAKIPASSYWDNVRIRYGGMLANFYRNIRWDVEQGEVVANCWLPPMAAHNLIAASEHVMAFSAGTSPTNVVVNVGPQSLEELLNSKRDLNIANPPDLNVLMADLRDEIVDDFPKLPFAFNIRLLGGDLEKEGITKNQRPGELVMSQKTVAEILTSIMTSANPSKDISGPHDPNCKLIWVVADDPDSPGEKAVLVTTRKAAAEQSYELPPAFQLE